MREYQACLITMVQGVPPMSIPVAAVAWGPTIVEVLAPDAPGIETAIRSYLNEIPAAMTHEALIAFGSASHPYEVEELQTIRSRSARAAALSVLQIRGLRPVQG
jgi:hypothetical protein